VPSHPRVRNWLVCLLWGGVLGAVVLGAGGRSAMRGIAVLQGAPPSFTLAGSLHVVLMGALSGLGGAAILMLLRTFVRGRWLVQTVAFYLALIALALWGMRPVDTQRLMLFLPLVLVYGFLLRILSRRRLTPEPTPGS
jgi:hypothetical protein